MPNTVELRFLLVIPAGIAGIQLPWRADQIHLPVFWIPAIPAGMTAVSTVLGHVPHCIGLKKLFGYFFFLGCTSASSLFLALVVLALAGFAAFSASALSAAAFSA